MNNRESGFYWVKYRGYWIVAEWVYSRGYDSYWSMTGSSEQYFNDSFTEIIELPIEYPK